MQNENVNLNKDFTVSRQAEEAQKAQEDERAKKLFSIQDAKDRIRIEKMVKTRDDEMQRDMQIKREEQEKTIRDEVQRRLDNQKAPSLDFAMVKRALGQGKSPDMVHDQVMAEFKATHARELGAFQAGLAIPLNKVIDKQIEVALEQQRQKEAEPTFEKDATRSPDSSRDAFQKSHDQKGGEKDWRSLKADREAKADNENKI